MKRLHLFEFEDQSWFPDVIRQGITDYLQFASNRFNLYRNVIPLLKKGLEKSGTNRIIDLCSGGGGGMVKIHENLKVVNPDAKIVLTDKYPNVAAFEKASADSSGSISFVEESVDAINVPESLNGFRTQFVSFHHFAPDKARQILENAAVSNAPIGIFEATERNVINFIAMLFTPIAVMLAVPFIRPFKWSRIFWTFIIPAIPFFTMWDGIVSVLRTYSPKELTEMTKKIRKPGYFWEIGRIKTKGSPQILYLLGYPTKAA
jgi:hypothetical protein